MVGSNRCYICEEPLVRGDANVACPECGTRYHASCADARVAKHCPRCADEGWISVVEF